MAKIAFAILGFTIMLNLATGLLFTLIPEFDVAGINSRFEYDSGAHETFTGNLEHDLRPSGGPVEDAGNAIWRILDMINIGFINNLLSGVQTYLFGFIKFLGIAMAPLLSAEMWILLFEPFVGIFYVINTLIYIVAGFSLWTNKDISGR